MILNSSSYEILNKKVSNHLIIVLKYWCKLDLPIESLKLVILLLNSNK